MTARDPDSAVAMDHLAHRRQFVMAPATMRRPGGGWPVAQVSPTHVVAAHPDLAMTQRRRGARVVTLLGFALDPDRPSADDADIVEALVASIETCDDVGRFVDRLGGRWVAIVHDGSATVVLNDAAAARQVHYACDPASGQLLCASQPVLLAQLAGFAPDEAALAFVRERGERDCEVYWMPGDRTLYAEVRTLLPNHRLDVERARVERFWPRDGTLRDAAFDAERARARCLELLRGQLAAVTRRGPIAVPMTAGWDSRLVLALSRPYAASTCYYTLSYPGQSSLTRDIDVPRRLLKSLRLAHRVIGYPATIDPELRRIVKTSVPSGNDAYCADVQALYEAWRDGPLCVTGDVAEVFKAHYRAPAASAGELSGALLGALCHLEQPFAVAAFDAWLAQARQAVPKTVDMLDLFCWEQMAGRWQATIRAEYDTVQDSFSPFACREFLRLMLSIDESRRRAPDFALLREFVGELWPAALRVPVNPPDRRSARHYIKAVARALGVRRPAGLRRVIESVRRFTASAPPSSGRQR